MTWWDEQKWPADMVIRALHDLRRWGEVTCWHSDSSTCWIEDLWKSDKLTCGKHEIWLVTRWNAGMLRNEKMTTCDLRRWPAEKWHVDNMTCRELTNAMTEIPDMNCTNMKVHNWHPHIWEMNDWDVEMWFGDSMTWWEMIWWLSDLMRISELRCDLVTCWNMTWWLSDLLRNDLVT